MPQTVRNLFSLFALAMGWMLYTASGNAAEVGDKVQVRSGMEVRPAVVDRIMGGAISVRYTDGKFPRTEFVPQSLLVDARTLRREATRDRIGHFYQSLGRAAAYILAVGLLVALVIRQRRKKKPIPTAVVVAEAVED